MAKEIKKFDPANIKVVKNVTLPILKQEDGKTYYIKITGPIFTGKEIKGEGKEAKEKPADLANIINLETGEEMQIIMNTVLKSNLEEMYPENGYVDKMFATTRSAIDGKRYKNYSIQEIEI
jgi:hypothetical protein